jgi:hypothetical protein
MFTSPDSLLRHEAMLLVRTLPLRIKNEQFQSRGSAPHAGSSALDGVLAKVSSLVRSLFVWTLKLFLLRSAWKHLQNVLSSVLYSSMRYKPIRNLHELLANCVSSGYSNSELLEMSIASLELIFDFDRADPEILALRSQREMIDVGYELRLFTISLSIS